MRAWVLIWALTALVGCSTAERFYKMGLRHQKAGRLALAQNDLRAATDLDPENADYQAALKETNALREKLDGVVETSSAAVAAAKATGEAQPAEVLDEAPKAITSTTSTTS